MPTIWFCLQDGVQDVIDVMDQYFLSKDEWDSVIEMGLGESSGENLLKKIPTNVKTALTRK
jgi:replication factor C subunit 1